MIVPVQEIFPGINTHGMPKLSNFEVIPEKYKSDKERPKETYGLGLLSGFMDMTAAALLTHNEYMHQKLIRVKDNVLVHIGAGNKPDGLKIAETLDAKAYVAIEPFYARNLEFALEDRESDIPTAIVPEDGRAFLRRLTQQELCILGCGLDDVIIHDAVYKKELEEEIAIKTYAQGVYIAMFSELSPPGMTPTPVGKSGKVGGSNLTAFVH